MFAGSKTNYSKHASILTNSGMRNTTPHRLQRYMQQLSHTKPPRPSSYEDRRSMGTCTYSTTHYYYNISATLNTKKFIANVLEKNVDRGQ